MVPCLEIHWTPRCGQKVFVCCGRRGGTELLTQVSVTPRGGGEKGGGDGDGGLGGGEESHMSALPHQNRRNHSPRLSSSTFCSVDLEQVSAVGQIKPLVCGTTPAARHSTLMMLGGGGHSRGGCVSKQTPSSDVSTAVGDFCSEPEFSGFSLWPTICIVFCNLCF